MVKVKVRRVLLLESSAVLISGLGWVGVDGMGSLCGVIISAMLCGVNNFIVKSSRIQ